MEASVLSGILLRVVVLLGALAWVPIWKHHAGGRLRTYVVIATGLGLLVTGEALSLYRLGAAAGQWLAWPTVYVGVVGYITILVSFLLWVRDVRDSRQTARARLATERRRLNEVRLNEAKLQAILNCASEYCIIVANPEGLITSYSSGGAHLLGWKAEEVVEKMHVSALHPPGAGLDLRAIREEIARTGYFETESPYLRKDGATFPALLTITPLKDPDGATTGFVGIARDISEIKQTEERLRRERDFIRSVIEVSEMFIVGTSLKDHTISLFNRGAERITGYGHDEVFGKSFADLFLPSDVRREVFDRIAGMAGSPDGVCRGENPILTKAGERRVLSWTHSLCLDKQGRPALLVSFGHDVTERREMEKRLHQAKGELEQANRELRRAAETDFLTGLASRRQATLQFQRELARSKRHYAFLGAIMLDLDRFKPVNDRHGHQAGDAVLVQVGKVLQTRARASDIVSRYGGEEFLVILPEADLAQTVKVAEELRKRIRDNPAYHGDLELQIRASFGVAEFNPADPIDAKTLIGRADQALYAAKGLGGNRVVSWNQLSDGKIEPAIADAEIIREVQKQVREITAHNQKAVLARLRALAHQVEGRSPYQTGHSDRVSRYASAVARHLGLATETVESIECAALLHDLGKAGIPLEVLNKPGALTLDDWALVMQHPAVSVRIIADLPFLKNEVPMIRHHHERPDGRGYPDGLSGGAIPEGARVLAVADAMDAMTCDRPHRPALPMADALQQLRDGAGRVFDAAVVEAAVACAQGNGDWPLPHTETDAAVAASCASSAAAP